MYAKQYGSRELMVYTGLLKFCLRLSHYWRQLQNPGPLVASFEERGISIHTQINGRVFCDVAHYFEQ